MSFMIKYGSLKRNNLLRIIKMKIKYLCVLLLVVFIYSCDDLIIGIGIDFIFGGDKILVNIDSYEFIIKFLLVDFVYVCISIVYLG